MEDSNSKITLHIEAEVDPKTLKWQGEPTPENIIEAYNNYYKHSPWEAFEIALVDDNFKVTKAWLD